MTPAIAIVGMACRYPDAKSVTELWENVLAQRRAFRRIPTERTNLADYFSADPSAPDRTYGTRAALIEDYSFDRVRYQISGPAYRAADLTHWLALDVAARAFEDAGLEGRLGDHLREMTAVHLGNTLTGEFSRAAALRLRWPYVRRILAAHLPEHTWGEDRDREMIRLESAYKKSFPPVTEETLAGSLSNTIAGRICNYFDLKGGGYSVDGACASSLIAVATACSALIAHDCDMALAGGVDLSLDPFELVGFAKAGALTASEMRVYDVRSSGFLPGEGCGMVVLQRLEDAHRQGRKVYALIRGWGISSDGHGGLTRPEVQGQLLALRRAYARAGFGPDTVGYFEGHGTGTAAGDATELRALCQARQETGAESAAALSTIKANVGHTKAAAGIAGLIKAAMAVNQHIRPPATGCETPHPEMKDGLRALREPELWPESLAVRAGVSAMGFGGINAHVVLEAAEEERRSGLSPGEVRMCQTAQDAEVFLFSSEAQVCLAKEVAASLSQAELTDFAAYLANEPIGPMRYGLVASNVTELTEKLTLLEGVLPTLPSKRARIGFLFPGQGSQNAGVAAELAQPAIVRESMAAYKELQLVGIEADIAIGHSLGEITALCWARVMDESTVERIAGVRSDAMAALKEVCGEMYAVIASAQAVREWIGQDPVSIAAINSPRQTVISGAAASVKRVIERMRAAKVQTAKLTVSHAFHSPLVAGAVQPLREYLKTENFHPPTRCIISTITGRALSSEEDVRALLCAQITSPVLFHEALMAAGDIDLWMEVGPGAALTAAALDSTQVRTFPLQYGSTTRRPFLEAVAAAWEVGASVIPSALFQHRFSRVFHRKRKFFANPCELVPRDDFAEMVPATEAPRTSEVSTVIPTSAIHVVRTLIARHAELPDDSFHDQASLLSDLHLNSITVAQLTAEAARQLGLAAPLSPLDYAGYTVEQVAVALEKAPTIQEAENGITARGIDTWVRPFVRQFAIEPLILESKIAPPGIWRIFGDVLTFSEGSLPPFGGVLLHLPAHVDEASLDLMLEAARAARELTPPSRFVLVQHGAGAASFARTIQRETGLPVCVVDLPERDPLAAERVSAEAAAVRIFSEVRYDEVFGRQVPGWKHLPQDVQIAGGERLPFLDGVLVASGGGKGIGAQCLMEAVRMGARKIAILGTSDAASDSVLDVLRQRGCQVLYCRVDITNRQELEEAARRIEVEMGSVGNILHCAGINRPQRLEELSIVAFRRTVEVKVQGLQNLLEVFDNGSVRNVIAFSSVIAHIGMPGEAHYAVANEWMEHRLAVWSDSHPNCRCIATAWSVWEGTGMGQRLGSLDALRLQGVSPISISEGVRAFRRAVCSDVRGTVILTGRLGAPPTLRFCAKSLPSQRFLERPVVHVPGVELICDVELSTLTDPYLRDHVFEGAHLFPAAFAMEAMSQAAIALQEIPALSQLTDIRFARPIIVPNDDPIMIRIVALQRSACEVEVRIRCSATGFQADHFWATCSVESASPAQALQLENDPQLLRLVPAEDLYGTFFFQKGSFARVSSYALLKSKECKAEIFTVPTHHWFVSYVPQTLVLGDPGLRDAVMHAIQVCIPQSVVLPSGVRRISFYDHAPVGTYILEAQEVGRRDRSLTYNVTLSTPEGELAERWEELELQIVSESEPLSHWPAALIAPYLERQMCDSLGPCSITLRCKENRMKKDGVYQKMFFHSSGNSGTCTSRSHALHFTMSITGQAPVGCDCEPVRERTPEIWQDLIGSDGLVLADLIAREASEDLHSSATRVWSSLETLKKSGHRTDSPLTLMGPEPQSAMGVPSKWVRLNSGSTVVSTWIGRLRDVEPPIVFAASIGS
jgi:enediyne polyketide synthase